MASRRITVEKGAKKLAPEKIFLDARHGQDDKIALWLGLSLFCLYLLTTAAHQPYGDEREYFEIAENILTRRRPVVTQIHLQADGQSQSVLGYTRFSLGQSFLIIPFVAAERMTAAIFSLSTPSLSRFIINALPAAESAATCALLFLLIRVFGNVNSELGLAKKSAVLLVLATALGTQLWPASRTLFADTSIAFLLTFALYALVRFRHAKGNSKWLIAAAWSAALMFACKNLLILTWPALLSYGFWSVVQRQKINPAMSVRHLMGLGCLTALPLLLSILLQLWYNDLRYDTVWLSGYHERREGDFGFSTPLLVGLYGILLSSGRSLFLYSPPCLLALFGARDFFRGALAEAVLIGGVAVPLTLAYAKWYSWHGGWEWGNRFFLFAIPLLLWLSVPAWRWMDQKLLPAITRRSYQTALILLLAVSIYIQGLGLLIHPAAYWSMTAHELSVLEHPTYEKGIWEIRDDMPLAHFVPEFSPLAAHHWLIQTTWSNWLLDDNTLARSAPWYSLNPKWAPKNVRPYLGFDLWFYAPSPEGGENVGANFLLGGLLAVMTVFGFFKLRQSLARFP